LVFDRVYLFLSFFSSTWIILNYAQAWKVRGGMGAAKPWGVNLA